MAAVYRPKLTFPGEYTECVENITRRHWALAPHQDEEKPNDDDGRGQQEKGDSSPAGCGCYFCCCFLLLLLLSGDGDRPTQKTPEAVSMLRIYCSSFSLLVVVRYVGRIQSYPIWWRRLLTISLIKGIYINL